MPVDTHAILSFAYYSNSEYLQLVSRTVRGTYILSFARCLSILSPRAEIQWLSSFVL